MKLNKRGSRIEKFTVADLHYLIETMIKQNPENQKKVVIVSSDEEGNDFGMLFGYDIDKESLILYPASGTVDLDDGE